MALQGYTVELVDRKTIKDFIETWHYSKSINGCKSSYCFALYNPSHEMVGAMFFGRLAMYNQYKRFSEDEDKVIELRRLCCIDDTPRNAESYFISRALKLLKQIWRSDGIVISYADAEYGHEGTIYKASNFESVGFVPGARVIDWNGKVYHDKTIRTKYNGKLKPFAQRVKDALENGEAFYRKTKGKHTYVYHLGKH